MDPFIYTDIYIHGYKNSHSYHYIFKYRFLKYTDFYAERYDNFYPDAVIYRKPDDDNDGYIHGDFYFNLHVKLYANADAHVDTLGHRNSLFQYAHSHTHMDKYFYIHSDIYGISDRNLYRDTKQHTHTDIFRDTELNAEHHAHSYGNLYRHARLHADCHADIFHDNYFQPDIYIHTDPYGHIYTNPDPDCHIHGNAGAGCSLGEP